MTGTLRLKVLGGFEAQPASGEPAGLPSKKGRALLAYLAVERARPQSRETLATLLWGDTGEERARHNLRQALASIRKVYGEVVCSAGDCLQIDPGACETDVGEFDRLANSDVTDDLRRCVSLYGGDLLEGLNLREPEFEEWLLVARSRLRKQACQAAARLAESLRAGEQHEQLVEALNDLLVIDPAYEPAHRDLMSSLADLGRRSDALRQYQVCVDVLRRELGATPSAETQRLYSSLLDENVVAAPDAAEPEQIAETGIAALPAVAVLPFENLSGERDTYFVDGIAEDLITALSYFHTLTVISRGSSFAYRGQDLSERAIADELGAQYLVRGSVQRAGDHVRINVQLLDALAGAHVWGHRYDRELEDVFVLQDEITSTLVSTLAGRVEAARLTQARKAPPERLDAYDLLLKGKDHHHRFTAQDCAACIGLFERAIEHDPDYAIAYAWLACGLGQAMFFKLDEISTLLDRCQAAAEKGLELDDNESECHRILAQTNLQRGNLDRALQHQERALFLNPNDDRIVCAMGEILAYDGRAEEAEQWVRKSMRLNPYHPPRYWTHLARAVLQQQRYAEVLDALERVGKARIDDLAYRVVAAVGLADTENLRKRVDELRSSFPDFDAASFVGGQSYRRQADRDALIVPLQSALNT